MPEVRDEEVWELLWRDVRIGRKKPFEDVGCTPEPLMEEVEFLWPTTSDLALLLDGVVHGIGRRICVFLSLCKPLEG